MRDYSQKIDALCDSYELEIRALEEYIELLKNQIEVLENVI